MIAVGLIGIPLYFRLSRGQVLQAREQEYVTAAQVLGSSKLRILIAPHPAQHRQSDDRGRLDLELDVDSRAGRAELHRRGPAAARTGLGLDDQRSRGSARAARRGCRSARAWLFS